MGAVRRRIRRGAGTARAGMPARALLWTLLWTLALALLWTPPELLTAQPLRPQQHPQPAPATHPQSVPGGAGELDINSASAQQLNALPGFGPAYTRRVIAGRPYRSKHQLVTRGVIPQAEYERIRGRIAAHRRAQ